MLKPKSTVEILQHLEKSNCGECGFPSCLAFALAVFKGEKHLAVCPRVDPDIAREYGSDAASEPEASPEPEEDALTDLQKKVEAVDLAEAAKRTEGRYANGKLTIKVLGKDLSIDSKGQLSSDIHINTWVAGPALNYILKSQGVSPTGKWVPLRELKDGKIWDNFFTQRCEKPLKKVADTYTDLFKDMIEIFNGKPVKNHYQSDVSLVIHPLPKVPLLICYWRPEDGLPSTLNIFFDANVEKNLPIGSIYTIGAGLAVMFEKLSLRHGVKES